MVVGARESEMTEMKPKGSTVIYLIVNRHPLAIRS